MEKNLIRLASQVMQTRHLEISFEAQPHNTNGT